MDAMFPPLPLPAPRLKNITYIFQWWIVDDDEEADTESSVHSDTGDNTEDAEGTADGSDDDDESAANGGVNENSNNGNGNEKPHLPLNLFIKLVAWAAGYGAQVTVEGAQDLDTRAFANPLPKRTESGEQDDLSANGGQGRLAVNGQGGEKTQESITGKAIVRLLKRELGIYALHCLSNPVPGMPLKDLEARVRKNIVFLTRAQYCDSIGQEEFDVETDVGYYKRRGSTLL